MGVIPYVQRGDQWENGGRKLKNEKKTVTAANWKEKPNGRKRGVTLMNGEALKTYNKKKELLNSGHGERKGKGQNQEAEKSLQGRKTGIFEKAFKK